MEIVTEKVDKFSENLKIGDEFRIGGLLVKVLARRANDHDEMVFDLELIGAIFKKRSKMRLIVPKKLPITTEVY